jgi:hypothetical protein
LRSSVIPKRQERRLFTDTVKDFVSGGFRFVANSFCGLSPCADRPGASV